MYPVQADRTHSVEGHPEVTSLRSRHHVTYLRTNGAIETRSTRTNEVVFEKTGADGLGVW